MSALLCLHSYVCYYYTCSPSPMCVLSPMSALTLLCLYSYVFNHYMCSPMYVSPIRESPMYVVLCLHSYVCNTMSVSTIHTVLYVCIESYRYVCTPIHELLYM